MTSFDLNVGRQQKQRVRLLSFARLYCLKSQQRLDREDSDPRRDLLEVLFKDTEATLEEVKDDVFEQRTKDGRVVGFIVMNFSKHDQDKLIPPFEIKVLPAA
ncbi:MAG: DUF2283 domain-containing protein [Deinococcota bacterium]